MSTPNLTELQNFIVAAKRAIYVGDGQHLLPYRLGSQDLQFFNGDWAYHDSYLGNNDFIGEEAVYYQGKVVWAMNYFGRILNPALLTGAQAGGMIKASLTRMYAEGRFLGGFEYSDGALTYTDTNTGDFKFFTGREWITVNGEAAYELVYHGGLVN